MDIKFSLREYMSPGDGIVQRIENAAKIGFAGIEVCGSTTRESMPDILRVCRDTGVVPNIMSASKLNILDPRPDERAACIAAFKEALAMCGEAGGVGVILPPLIITKMQNLPRIPDLSPLATTAKLEADLLTAILSDLADFGASVGADIIIEPLNRYEQWWPCTLQHGVDICAAAGKPGVSMMADFFHMNIEDADWYAEIKKADTLVKNVHLADSQRLLPGYGHTDFRPGLRALREIGYQYYMGFECGIPGDPWVELPKAMDYIRQMAAG